MQSINELAEKIREFAKVREWEKYHSPKNLAMALSVEAGELVEIFQWLSEDESRQLSEDKIDELKDEMADVFIYLLNLSDKFDIDLIDSTVRKIAKNEKKYPVSLVKGKADKYTKYIK